MTIDDLWGDLPEVGTIKSPKVILEEQAALLTDKTNGLLSGLIRDNTAGDSFILYFEIIVPSLNNYTYSLLVVVYEIGLYPARVALSGSNDFTLCESEEAFKLKLKSIFSSQGTRNVISKLLTHLGGIL